MKRKVFLLLFVSLFTHSQIQIFAQGSLVKGERVILKECGNYAVAPVDGQPTSPNAGEKSQLIKQIGEAEYSQLIKYWYVSQWPDVAKEQFMNECEKMDFRQKLIMYKIAVLTNEEGYKTAIVRIPESENKSWLSPAASKRNLYLQVPDNDLMAWNDYEGGPNTNSSDLPAMQVYDTSGNADAFVYNPRPGDKLIYKVSVPDGDSYDFIITIKKFIHTTDDAFEKTEFPAAFLWQINESADKSGEVFISRDALTSATDYNNYFSNGVILTLINQSSVFLSSKNWYEPASAEDRSTVMNMTGTEEKFYKNAENFEYLKVKANDETYLLPVYRFNNAKDGTGTYSVYVQDNSFCPLIIKMNLDFEIELKEIVPVKK